MVSFIEMIYTPRHKMYFNTSWQFLIEKIIEVDPFISQNFVQISKLANIWNP